MRTFPKKVIAIFLGTLLAEIFFLIPVSAQEAPVAACAWEQQSTYYDVGKRQQITTSCSEGKDIFPDSNCLEAKPTYPSSIYTSSKAICCCPKGITSNSTGQTEIEPPKFKIPELQVNFGVNFSAPDCDAAGGETECQINWLGEYLTAVYNYALKIGGILATVMLMAGGAMWLISGGDAGKINTAKDIVSGSIIGLVLLFSSFLILSQINPNLVTMKAITLGSIKGKEMDAASKTKNSGAAATYSQAGCATNEELKNGIDFYATGYCKPTYENTDRFFCFIAMNCSCPNGVDTSKNCDKWFGNTYPGYEPCKPFSADTPYCGQTKSGATPEIGTIAGPACDNLPYDNNTQVCFTKDGQSTTYTITDRGGGIQGKRIDIWTGDCSSATKVSGVGTLKLGPCQ